MLDEVAIQYDGAEGELQWGSLAQCYDPHYKHYEDTEDYCVTGFETNNSGQTLQLLHFPLPQGGLRLRGGPECDSCMPLPIRNRIYEIVIQSREANLDVSTGNPLGHIYVDQEAHEEFHYDYFTNWRFDVIMSTVDQVSTFNDFAKLQKLFRTTFTVCHRRLY